MSPRTHYRCDAYAQVDAASSVTTWGAKRDAARRARSLVWKEGYRKATVTRVKGDGTEKLLLTITHDLKHEKGIVARWHVPNEAVAF